MRTSEQVPDWRDAIAKRSKDFAAAQSNPAYVEMLRRCEASYWPWQKLRFRARGQELDPALLWIMAKLARQPHYRTLPLFGKSGIALKFNTPEFLQREMMQIDHELAGGVPGPQDTFPSPSEKEKFILSALREEAIASSMLEGAVTTRQEAEQMLRTGRRPRSRGEEMVLNNYQAIQFIRENKKRDMSPEFLLELQEILTGKTLDDPGQVGRFRSDKDVIHVVDHRDNEIVHVPPPASELSGRLRAFCDFANRSSDEKDFVHPLIAASVLHFQIGFDHPFCDGNGRTARSVFYWMMLRSGYWIFEYLPISRLIYQAPGKYTRAFVYCETDDFDVTYFLMYKARLIEMARRDLAEYVAKNQAENASAREIFPSDKRLNERQRDIVLHAARSPSRYFTIAEQQRQYGVTYSTARQDLLSLVEWKYLKQMQLGNRFEFAAGPKLVK
jgi:Fic family protein